MSNKNTLLWRIKGNAQIGSSYLFGTMHVQDLRAFSNLGFIKEKIDECSAFAAEYNLDHQQVGVTNKMALPNGVTIKTLIPEKKYLKLRRIVLKSTKLDLDFL